MSTTQLRVFAGVGSESAPIGSLKWAERVRYTMQRIVKTLDSEPERFDGYRKLCFEHRAWTMMNRPDGSFFDSWEEFCDAAEPWGLGHKWETLRPVLEVAIGKKAVQLGTVAPAKAPPGKVIEKDHDGPLVTTSEKRLRAIAERAPHVVKDLFREDLIGVNEAAKLGPKNPTPEEAAKVTEVANAAVAVAKASPKPETPRQKREVQRKVNATVREQLGLSQDVVAGLVKAVRKLTDDERRAFFASIVGTYSKEIGWSR